MGYAQYLLLAAQAAIQTSISPYHQKLKASVVVDIGNATWLHAVWEQMVTGGGHAPLTESMAVLGVRSLTKKAFITIEKHIGQWWWTLFEDSMKQAGNEERAIAIANGRYHQGVPAITVIIDGGWSKRSHKHSYNAKSGVGIIIGKEAKKICI